MLQIISGLTLGYTSQRPSTETLSVCMTIGSNSAFAAHARFLDLRLAYGQTGIGVDPACTTAAPLWNCIFDNIRIAGWSQNAVNFTLPGGMATGCVFTNLYCDNTPGTSPQSSADYAINLTRFTETVFNNLTIGGSLFPSTGGMFIDACGNVTINGMHVEGNTFSADYAAVVNMGPGTTTNLIVNGLTVQINTFSGTHYNCIIALQGWNESFVINGLWSDQITSGTLYIADFGSTQGSRGWLWAGDLTLYTAIMTGGAQSSMICNGGAVAAGQAAVLNTQLLPDAEQLQTLISAHTLTSQQAAQQMFNASTNGAVTVQPGTYFFECFFTLSSLSSSSGSFGFALGGTAAIAAQLWETEGNKAALATAASAQNTVNTAANTAIVTATTNTVGWARVNGKIRVTASGTVIPQVSLGVAAAAVVGTDSYFRIWSAGSSSVMTIGDWS